MKKAMVAERALPLAMETQHGHAVVVELLHRRRAVAEALQVVAGAARVRRPCGVHYALLTHL